MSAFGGIVYIQTSQPMNVTNPGPGQPAVVLKTRRVAKPMFGLELSVSALVSKIGGGGGKSKTKRNGGS